MRKKLNMDSLILMQCENCLEDFLDCYPCYLDFLEDTWFYEGYPNQDKEYQTIFEKIIINFYQRKGERI